MISMCLLETQYFNRYITNHFEKLYPLKYEKVSSINLQKFIDDIEQKHSPFVAQICLKIGRAVCNYSMKHKLIKENKFLAVDNVSVSPQDKHHLTETQEKEVLKNCMQLYPKYYALFFTLINTGMRIGELLALEISDINYDKKSVKVNKQFTLGKFKDGTKNPARIVKILERDVYLTNDTLKVLREHIKTLPADTKILFPSKVNGYLSANNLRIRVWKPLLIYSGINERVRMHDLRGSYADIAFSKGASVKFVQNQLGHAKAQTTLDIYTQNNKDIIADGLNKINGFLKPSKQDPIPDK